MLFCSESMSNHLKWLWDHPVAVLFERELSKLFSCDSQKPNSHPLSKGWWNVWDKIRIPNESHNALEYRLNFARGLRAMAQKSCNPLSIELSIIILRLQMGPKRSFKKPMGRMLPLKESTALCVTLSKLWEKVTGQGVTFYQVSTCHGVHVAPDLWPAKMNEARQPFIGTCQVLDNSPPPCPVQDRQQKQEIYQAPAQMWSMTSALHSSYFILFPFVISCVSDKDTMLSIFTLSYGLQHPAISPDMKTMKMQNGLS